MLLIDLDELDGLVGPPFVSLHSLLMNSAVKARVDAEQLRGTGSMWERLTAEAHADACERVASRLAMVREGWPDAS